MGCYEPRPVCTSRPLAADEFFFCFSTAPTGTNGGPSVGGRGDPEEVPTEARKQGGEWGKTELLLPYLFPISFPLSPQAGDAFWLQWVSDCRWAWPSDPKLARPRPCSAVFRPDHDFGAHPAPAELEFMLITLLLRLSPVHQRVTVFACTGEKDP